MLARNLRLLLLHKEKILMSDLSSMYKSQYGVDLSPALYGFTTLYHLLQSFPHILELKGKSTQKYIVLSSVLPPPGELSLLLFCRWGFIMFHVSQRHLTGYQRVTGSLVLTWTKNLFVNFCILKLWV